MGPLLGVLFILIAIGTLIFIKRTTNYYSAEEFIDEEKWC